MLCKQSNEAPGKTLDGTGRSPRRIAAAVVALGLAAVLAAMPAQAASWQDRLQGLWGYFQGNRLPDGIAQSNGRIEAEQILVATKVAGRVRTVFVEEGDIVEAGQLVAQMDTAELAAQLAAAQAQARRAERSIAAAEASLRQRHSELRLAQQEHQRTTTLNRQGYATGQQLDQRRSQLAVAEAAEQAARANLEETQAMLEAADAEAARVRSQIDDSALRAPKRSRVEYKLAQSGEVVGAGAPVATLLDLADVYMTAFFPAAMAGRLGIGDEARLVLDPAPAYVVPATVSFVASEAQFTPRTVETKEEREKLMFRVKLRIASDLLVQYESRVKVGVRGMAYVRSDTATPWPSELDVKLPR